MKWLVIGDLHGEINFLHAAMRIAESDGFKILSLGDVLDSYHHPVDTQYLCMTELLELVDQGKAKVLLGNHELSYMYYNQRCGGWNQQMQCLINHLVPRMKSTLAPFHVDSEHDVLFIHGGITKKFWDRCDLSLNSDNYFAIDLARMAADLKSPFYDVGLVRGGHNSYGGPIWCDWNHEFNPVPGLTQVVGHTNPIGRKRLPEETFIGKIRVLSTTKGPSYNIDCLSRSFECITYDDRTGELTPVRIVRNAGQFELEKMCAENKETTV